MTLVRIFTVFVAVILFSGSAPAIARAQGRVIQAQDGDLVMVPAASTITVARAVGGHLKVVPHDEGRSLVVMLDEGPELDGMVDATYRFDVPQPPYPTEYAWEGPGTFEEYEQLGLQRRPTIYAVVLPQGRILLRTPAGHGVAVPEHVAAFQIKGHSARRVRETFEAAEHGALTQPAGSGSLSATVRLSPSAQTGAPVRVGGTIREPRKIKDVPPVMPEAARQAGVIGIVIVEATIDAQGRVSSARILRSIPLLDQAALDAVRQWEFEPVLVNGVPQPVVMTVTVPFTGHP